MKKNIIKTITGCIVLVLFATYSICQTTTTTTKKEIKLDKNKVPKAVADSYYVEWPSSIIANWFGYPALDNNDIWYDDSYEDEPAYNSELPYLYGVEFTANNVKYKAIYTKTGVKIAVHKILESDLPTKVLTALSMGQYKHWTLGKDKEEIFKNKDSDDIIIYRVKVYNGKEKHTLFFQSDGKLLRDKKVA